MTNTGKVVSIAVLTVFLLGFSNYIQQSVFIVPFPFISEFLFVTILGLFVHTHKPWTKLNSYLAVFAISGVLSGRFLWEIILDFDQLVYLFESTYFIEVFKAIQYLALSLVIFELARCQKNNAMKLAHFSAIFLLILTLLLNASNFLIAWYFLYGILSFISLKAKNNQESSINFAFEFFVGVGLIYLMSAISMSL
jgi:hypothetical protein